MKDKGFKGIGANVRYYRERKGLKQSELAQILGYSNHTPVVKIENDTLDPAASVVVAIARALGCTICELFNEIDVKKSVVDEFEPYIRNATAQELFAARRALGMPEPADTKKENGSSLKEAR